MARKRRTPRRRLGHTAAALGLALAVPLVVSAGAAGTGAPTAAPPATTPVTNLQAAWAQALAASPQMSHAAISAYAYDVTTGQPLAAVHPDWRLTPASVNKLFTSAAALATLGPNFRYTTTVAADPAPGGAIYLVGGGDPWLDADGGRTLEAMAQAVALQVHSASRVVGVSAAYGPTAPGTGWPIGDLPFSYAAPISALTSGRDEVYIVVSPGAAAGDPPHVAVNPRNPSTPPPASLLHVVDRATTGPVGSRDTIDVATAPGTNDFVVKGRIPLGAAALGDYLALAKPTLVTAATFQSILAADGVHFSAPATTGTLPARTRTLLVHRSKPLTKYLQIQNTFSINSMAESLFRYLGVARFGTGTAAAAQSALVGFLQGQGIATDSVHVDGSGLSPDDEASAADVVALLAYAARQPWFTVFEHSLIHVGRTNQCSFLCGFMDGTAADGTVWLKTGNLDNQWNYAGYATAENGDLIAFAILIDGLPSGRYLKAAKAPIDAMTVDVASYPSETARAPTQGTPDTAPAALPSTLRGSLGVLTAGDVVGGAMVQVAGPGAEGRTTWQLNGGVRLDAGALPRLAVALAALKHLVALPAAEVLATGSRQGATLNGALVLDGQWNPNLTDQSVAALAQAVAARGVRQVTGPLEAVSVPAPAWSSEGYPPDVSWELASSATAPPISSLAVDQDQVGLLLTPPAAGADGVDAARVVPAGTPVSVGVEAPGAPVGETGTAATWIQGRGFVVTGRTDTPAPQSLTVSAADPAAVAAARLRQDLAADGVQVRSTAIIAKAPAGARVVARSPAGSLGSVAASSLSSPSGFFSLDLYGLLGRHADADLKSELGPLDDVSDPAGLGSGDYVTAGSVAQMLARAYAQGGAARALVQGLGPSWTTTSLEGRTAAGLLTIDGRTYVYCLIENGLPPSASGLQDLAATP